MAVPPVQKITPLNWQVPIVNPDGTPSAQFIRLWQQLFGNGENSDDKVQQLIDAELQAGAGIAITPDGHLLSNPTISADLQAMLDAITSTQGSILYRSGSQWTFLGPGTSGKVLQTNGAAADPTWVTPASGGGGNWTLLGGSYTSPGVWDQTVDGSTSAVVFNGLIGFSEIMLVAQSVTKSVSGTLRPFVSVDNGVTYFSTSGNYQEIAGNGTVTNFASAGDMQTTAATAARYGRLNILKSTPTMILSAENGFNAGQGRLFAGSSSPVNAVMVTSSAGGNLTGGSIKCTVR